MHKLLNTASQVCSRGSKFVDYFPFPDQLWEGNSEVGSVYNITKLLRNLLALKFLYTCLKVLLPHFYTTCSSLVLSCEGKTWSFCYFFVWFQTQSCMEYFPIGVTCSPSGGCMGLKQLRQWHERFQGKNPNSKATVRALICLFPLSLFSKKQVLSVPLYCVSVDSALSNSMGFGFHTHFSLSVL